MEFIGVYGGLVAGIMGWYFGRQKMNQANGLDEMYNYIWNKAKSISWYFTIATIYVLMTLALFDISISLMPALAILLFVQLSSWALSGALLSIKLTKSKPIENYSLLISFIIASTLLVMFSVLSVLFGNWKLLLFAIPPVLLNIIIMVRVKKKMNE